MKSPESAPQENRDAKWQHLSTQNCSETWDVLAQLEELGPLPEGILSKNLLRSIASDLMDYAEKAAKHDALWDALPEQLPSLPEGVSIRTKQDLKSWLDQLIQESR